MKAMHEHLILSENQLVQVKWDDFPHFTFPWHFHSEYELVYVIKSFGKRFVADHVGTFRENDLVLLGSSLPHFWKNDELFYQGDPKNKVNAIVIHFPEDFFSLQLQTYPEFHRIKELLHRSARGIHFTEETAKHVGKKIKKLLRLKGLERTLSFLKILDQLASEQNFQILASESYRAEQDDWSGERLDKIMHFINLNYLKKIDLETISQKIGMNRTSFCRYFKEKTGKSFSGFIMEMRVGYACKLLIEDKLSISQICYESGYNSLANFNRQFKNITSYTPTQYREEFYSAK